MGAEPHAIAGSSLAASASVDGYNSADEHEVAVSAPAETIEAFAARMAATRGLQLVPMLRDGNCLFRAVADRVYGDHAMHDVVRQQTLDHVAAESAHFSPYVAEDIHTYVARKRRDGVYGNHVELQALSELYNRRVEVRRSRRETHHRRRGEGLRRREVRGLRLVCPSRCTRPTAPTSPSRSSQTRQPTRRRRARSPPTLRLPRRFRDASEMLPRRFRDALPRLFRDTHEAQAPWP